MARILLWIMAGASAIVAISFLISQMGRPGMSFAVAFLVASTLATAFVAASTKGETVSSEGKLAGWIAIGLAFLATGYIALFFTYWLLFAIVWVALHGIVVYAILSSPPDRIEVKRVAEEREWLLYEFSNASGTLGRVSVNRSNGQLQIVDVTRPGTETIYNAQLSSIFHAYYSSKNYP